MTLEKESCPLCDLPDQQVEVFDFGKRKHLDCPCCGEFTITTTAAKKAQETDVAYKLSAWLRHRKINGASTPEITTLNLREITENLVCPNVLEKQSIIIREIARRSNFPGQPIDVEPKVDFAIAWCKNEQEFVYHLSALNERDFVKQYSTTKGKHSPEARRIYLTPNGWRLLEAENRPRAISNQAFVAMSFASEMNSPWEHGIRVAIEKAQYRPMRIDAQPTIDRIDVQIMAEIRRSHLVVADVTLQRPGVYFEAGYAIGLGIPVYWCVRSDELDKVHFDTRQYNHIVWNSPEDLQAKLYDFIYAISGPAQNN